MVEAEELKNLFQQEIIGGIQPPLPPVVTALVFISLGSRIGLIERILKSCSVL